MKKVLLITLLLVMAVFVMAQRLTIVHINDTHGHIWAEGEYGGLAAVATLINQVRAENPNTLFLHAGDINTGVPESDLQDAAPDIVALNLMKVDAVAIGNHEFDNDASVLAKQMEIAHFPFLSANIYKDGEPAFQEYIIKEIAGIKVAIVGFTAQETEILEYLYAKDYEWKDVIEVAKEIVPKLEAQADIIIALTHMGSNPVLVGANSWELAKAVDGIDVIVDGHSHTFYERPEIINETIIVSAGEWAKNLGKLELEIVDETVIFVSFRNLPVIAEEIEPDFAVATVLDYFKKAGGEALNTVVGETTIKLEGDRGVVRAQDTNLGYLICDAMVWKSGADLAITNSGGIRASINAGPITYRDILTVLPFGNTLYVVDVPGTALRDLLQYTATREAGQGAMPQVSGVTYVIENGEAKDILVNGAPIDDNRVYKVATNNYLASGGDGYAVLAGLSGYDTGFVLADVVVEFVGEISPITGYQDSGRITRK
ncbi:5'-nucleotidase C-terminal domain-containing protein [Mesotoga sp.]|jgi:5'-nucleotidase/UDP-sugar diphosphatase